jgi:transcriptional regulator
MYLPKHFREDNLQTQHDLMRAYPFATLISAGVSGLMANSVPFLIYPDEGEYGVLRAHVARANPHWQELQTVAECMVLFQGADDYIRPAWYPSKQEHGKVVPTWNFVSVHAWGAPTIVEDDAWLRRQVGDLTYSREHAQLDPWKVEDAPADFTAALFKAIVGIEIPIARIEGKWKVSQNRPAADRNGVVEGLRGQGEMSEPMANLVEQSAR